MTCIIIEDQPPAQRILKKFIQDIGTLELQATFSDALKALEYLKTETVDLIFLDILTNFVSCSTTARKSSVQVKHGCIKTISLESEEVLLLKMPPVRAGGVTRARA